VSYLVVGGLFASWILVDATTRRLRGAAVLWTVGTLLLGPFAFPFYLAERPLAEGETREGGTAWNVLRNFAMLWTMMMAVGSFTYLVELTDMSSKVVTEAERAGFGMGTLASLWVLPTAGAACLGVLLKKDSIVETGPTGPLVGSSGEASAMSGWLGILAVSIVALIAIVAVEKRAGGRMILIEDSRVGSSAAR
jgi:hypothetical protein